MMQCSQYEEFIKLFVEALFTPDELQAVKRILSNPKHMQPKTIDIMLKKYCKKYEIQERLQDGKTYTSQLPTIVNINEDLDNDVLDRLGLIPAVVHMILKALASELGDGFPMSYEKLQTYMTTEYVSCDINLRDIIKDLENHKFIHRKIMRSKYYRNGVPVLSNKSVSHYFIK